MFDQVILFIDAYFLWVAIFIAAYKFLHIVFYKGIHPKYIISIYFVIFSGVEISSTKNYNQRQRFRKVHNLLTIGFYAFFLLWAIVHFTVRGGFSL